ncbi:MAG TPA: MlaD family protein [Terriglobales bacterium]
MPSQKQLKWSQLKVGITVIVALTTLGVLIFLMSGSGGVFTPKVELKTYVDNASGLRVGAPVRLSGVDVGNVSLIQIVHDQAHHRTPVLVTMKVNHKFHESLLKNSETLLSTAGVLGETFIDIDNTYASGPEAVNGDVLPSRDVPDFQDMVRAGQGTLQNMDALLKRLDRIIAFVESGKGSVGKLIYDPTLYNRLSDTVNEFQGLVNDIANGKGTLGKLVADETMYNKVNATLDKVNVAIDDLNAGKGTMGKLLKDPALYDNANNTVANIRQLTDDINSGKGALGKFAKDPQFAARVQNIADKLSAIADRLDAGEGTAGKFLRDPSLYNNADQTLVESRELIKAIRQNPKKYLTIHMKIF